MAEEKLEEAPYMVIWEKVFVNGKPYRHIKGFLKRKEAP